MVGGVIINERGMEVYILFDFSFRIYKLIICLSRIFRRCKKRMIDIN